MASPIWDKLATRIPTDNLSLALYAILPFAIWLYTALLCNLSFPTLRNSHILLLIAHPDDEAMFFAPTILNLTRPSLNNTVKILCLSNGNADGLGATRHKELLSSAALLGVAPRHVVCLDDPDLQDSMTASWPAAKVAAVLAHYLLPEDYTLPSDPSISTTTSSSSIFKPTQRKPAPAAKDTPPPRPHSDVVLTFDARGVSAHPNHTALYHGALALLTRLRAAHPGWACPVTLYTLTTVALPRKYASIVDVPTSVLLGVATVAQRAVRDGWAGRGKKGARGGAGLPSWLLYVSGVGGVRRGQRAMYAAHKSQMRWFRWGWIGIGRYMAVNDLRRVD